MKFKGLGRLRWYCTPCQKQCGDENAFKQHTLFEGHFRTIQSIFEGSVDKTINKFSAQFHSEFLQLLRTSHGEKSVQINRFYQSYIIQRDHVHLNATRWRPLTEFTKWLGREGLCMVEEKAEREGGGGGFHISFIGRSPASIFRQETLFRVEKQESTSAKIEAQMLQQQIDRARQLPVADHPRPTDINHVSGEAVNISLDKTIDHKQQPSRERPNVFRAARKKVASGCSKTIDDDRQVGKRGNNGMDAISSDERSMKKPRNY